MKKKAHYSDIILRRIIRLIYSIIANIKTKWWGVKIGKAFKVSGPIYFRKLPKSKIIIGDNCTCNSLYWSNLIGVNRPCMFSTIQKGASIQIGNNCGFSGTVIGAFESVILGNNVRCGANTLITDSDWHLDDPRAGEVKPVIIKDNVWLGVNAVVLKGVTIGENTVIGANSVVVKDIPANVIAAGNPCKVIKEIHAV